MNRVSVLELNGQLLFTIGGEDTPLGRLHSPYGLVRIYIYICIYIYIYIGLTLHRVRAG